MRARHRRGGVTWGSVRQGLYSARAVVLLVGTQLSCSQLLAPVDIETEAREAQRRLDLAARVDPSALPSGPPENEPCVPGQRRCTAEALQECADTGNAWVTLAVCASAALCDAEAASCQAAACGFGELRCSGERLELCNADRDGFQLLELCTGPAFCSTRENRCRTEPCQPGEQQCSGGALQTCSASGASWEQGAQCATQGICEASLTASTPGAFECGAAACGVGQRRCVGSRLEQCNPAQTGWSLLDICGSQALCDAEQTTCVPSACIAGAVRCSADGTFERCRSDQTGYDPEQECSGAGFCSTEPGAEGCAEMPCVEGALRCNGEQIERCGIGRGGFEVVGNRCLTSALCTVNRDGMGPDALCADPTCAPNQYRCVGAQLQRCSEGRAEYLEVEQCATGELCSAVLQRCEEPRCEVGARRCVGERLEVCNAGQTAFELEETCGSAAECSSDTGSCAEPCVEGASRCNDAVLERCDARAQGWQPIAFCTSAALCNAADERCEAPICQPDTHRCNGQALEECSPGQDEFRVARQCGEAETCDAAAAQCDLCPAETLRCAGDTLQRCSADGQQLRPVQVCGAGLCQTVNGVARCLECQPNTQRCDGAVVRECSPDGRETEIDRCPTAAQCETDGSTASCAEVSCALGELQCAPNGEVLACNSTRTAFEAQVPQVPCPPPSQCNPAFPSGCGGEGEPVPPPGPDLVDNLPPYEFEPFLNSTPGREIVQGLGPLVVDVPTDWSIRDDDAWKLGDGSFLGPGLSARTGSDQDGQGFGVSGMFFGATNLDGLTVESVLGEFAGLLTEVCGPRASRGGFQGNGHEGLMDVWTNCGGTGLTMVAVAASPPGGEYVAFLRAQITAVRDRAAVDRILETFVVSN